MESRSRTHECLADSGTRQSRTFQTNTFLHPTREQYRLPVLAVHSGKFHLPLTKAAPLGCSNSCTHTNVVPARFFLPQCLESSHCLIITQETQPPRAYFPSGRTRKITEPRKVVWNKSGTCTKFINRVLLRLCFLGASRYTDEALIEL